MEQLIKRQKVTKESTITDITSCIREISDSISSISERYRAVLRVNKAVVLYSRNAKKRQDSTLNEIQNNLKQTNIE